MNISVPPKKIPAELLSAYTLGGKVRVEDWYFNESYPQDKPKFYSKTEIEALVEKARRRQTHSYSNTDLWLHQALDKFPVQGLTVAVMGSTVPWYEAVALERGGRVTTIEYNKIISDYPGLELMTVAEFQKQPRVFDAAFSISSFEHDGLGRYGDPLNPNGDLETMQKMKSIVKPGGLLFLAVPVGKDKVVWNAHRIYGRLRLPMLTKGWQIVGKFGYNPLKLWRDTKADGGYQPVLVLKNI